MRPEQIEVGAECDPDRCATPRCKGEPAMTYLGKPLCQACWEAATRETTSDGAERAEETTMSKKSASNKKSKTPKAAKVAKATKKSAGKPKAERKPAGDAKPKRVSALDAAAEVLRKAGKPMRSRGLIIYQRSFWPFSSGSSWNAHSPASETTSGVEAAIVVATERKVRSKPARSQTTLNRYPWASMGQMREMRKTERDISAIPAQRATDAPFMVTFRPRAGERPTRRRRRVRPRKRSTE